MKNRLTVILIPLLVLYTLVGCGSKSNIDANAETVWAAIEDVIPENSLPVMMDIDASALKSYYGLGNAEIIAFAGQMPLLNISATEILIIRAQKNQTEAVYQAIEARLAELEETWSGADVTQYALVQNGRIVQNSDWLLFVVAEAAEEIANAFNAHLDSYKS